MRKFLITSDCCDYMCIKTEDEKEVIIRYAKWLGYDKESFKIAIENMDTIEHCIELFEDYTEEKINCFVEITNEIVKPNYE